MREKIAEVVEATSAGFVGQCYELYRAPSLGAFVRVGEPPLFAVVHNVTTGALDPGRRVIARGAEEESEAAVYDSNPQLARLLSTHVEALFVGYAGDDGLRHGLPPSPPRIHAFVYACDSDDVASFTQRFDFLRLLVRSLSSTADDTVAACLRGAAASRPEPERFLLAAGRALAQVLAGDVGRLSAILRRISG